MTPEPSAATRQRQSRTGSEQQARAERGNQEQHNRVQGKAASSVDDGDGAAAGRATSNADRLPRTISSSSTDRQRQQQPDRTSSKRDISRDREADTFRDSRVKSKLQQQAGAAAPRSSRDGVGVRIGNFSNPSYCPHPPPSDPSIKYWRGRDGYVHDRQGNKWDPNTKVLLEAAASSAASQGTEQAGRAAAAGPRSVTTGSRGTKASSPTEHSSKRPRSVSDDKQQRQRQSDKPEERSSAAATPIATPGAGGVSDPGPVCGVISHVLPEELDVDMEIEEQHEQPAAHPALPVTTAAGHSKAAAEGVTDGTEHSQQQQRRSRPFGSAARRPPALQVTPTTGAAVSPAADKSKAAAGGVSGGGMSGGGRTPTASMPPASPPPALSPSVVSGSSNRTSLMEAGHCNTEYQNVALEALQHNLSTLDTTSFK